MTDADREKAAGPYCYCGQGRLPPRPPSPVGWIAAAIAAAGVGLTLVSGYADLRGEIDSEFVAIKIRLSTVETSLAGIDGTRFDARDAAALRSEISSQDASIRQFARTNCLAIANLQRAQGMPVTNDCQRP